MASSAKRAQVRRAKVASKEKNICMLLRLELTPGHMRRLRELQNLHFNQPGCDISDAARWVVEMGILHSKNTSNQLDHFINWMQSEGFKPHQSFEVLHRQLTT